jgi:hypothetical protein
MGCRLKGEVAMAEVYVVYRGIEIMQGSRSEWWRFKINDGFEERWWSYPAIVDAYAKIDEELDT